MTVEKNGAIWKGKDVETRIRKSKTKALYFWTCEDVMIWLKKHCGQYFMLYSETFINHAIDGRTLLRINEWKLQKMNIDNPLHREEIMRHIMRLRLKTEGHELQALEETGNTSVDVRK